MVVCTQASASAKPSLVFTEPLELTMCCAALTIPHRAVDDLSSGSSWVQIHIPRIFFPPEGKKSMNRTFDLFYPNVLSGGMIWMDEKKITG